MSLLRVHSKDLHEHVVEEAGECLESGLYTDVVIRCKAGETVHAHRLVLAAVSPYLRTLLDVDEDVTCLDLPEHEKAEIEALVSIVYCGSIDASLEEIRGMISLAHSLYIPVPVSDQLNAMLGMNLPVEPVPVVPPGLRTDQFNPMLAQSMNGVNMETMSVIQQQILQQYALINGLVSTPGHPTGPPGPSSVSPHHTKSKKLKGSGGSNLISGHPALALHDQSPEKSSKTGHNAQLNQIINSCYKPDSASYTCSICDSTYTNKGNFKQHVEKHLKSGDLPTQSISGLNADTMLTNASGFDTVSNLYHCAVCNSTYNHPGNFKQHMLKHDREQKNRIERNPESNHLNSVLQSAFADRVDNGDPSKTYVCEECNRTFKHPGNFKQHMASHNRPQTSFASMFKRPMPGLVKMVAGETTNGNRKDNAVSSATNWECPECGEKLDRDVSLQAHLKTEHDIEMVMPPVPTISSSSLSSTTTSPKQAMSSAQQPVAVKLEDNEELLEEMKVSAQRGDEEAIKALAIAAGEARLANFHCDVPGCYQSFTTEGWLIRHKHKQHPNQKQHLGPRIFTCTQCGKQFNKPSKLTQHVKTHSPESHYKYPCDICGKKFTRPQHVNRHKLLHTGERPHSCPTCDKTFAREDKLKTHVKSGCSGLLDYELVGHQEDDDSASTGEDSLAELPAGLTVGVVG